MSRADSLRTKLNKKLIQYGPQSRAAWKRVVSKSGGDDLIGRPGSVTNTDTQLSPQPLYTVLSKERELTATLAAQPGDYHFTISADSLSLADLQNKNMMLVLKDSNNNVETLRTLHHKILELNGIYIAFEVYARSTSV